MTPLDCAIELARQGFATFPVARDKCPTSPHGFKDASSETDAVRELWRQHPGPLVGIATGPMSGVDVLDLDRKHGAADWWLAHRHQIPVTRTHRTRSGGLHLLFRHAVGLRCSNSRIAAGVDVRAEGGCAIWWPCAGFPVLDSGPIVDWPEWLADIAMPRPEQPSRDSPKLRPHILATDKYAAGALRRACDIVAQSQQGRRNHTLNVEAYSLARFIKSGALSAQDVADNLAEAALASGLGQREIAATLASGLRAAGGAE